MIGSRDDMNISRLTLASVLLLDPNTAYQLSNGHTYLTDGTGRVTSVEGALTNTTFDRNNHQQCAAGKCGMVGD